MGNMKSLNLSSPIVMSAGIAAAATCAIAAPALAADPLRETGNAELVRLLNAQVAPRYPAASYSIEASGRSFVLDRTGPVALLKYEDSDEVVALTVAQAQRGDEVFKNDVGRNVLRVTELGNAILFTTNDKNGVPVGLDKQASPLGLPSGSGDLVQHVQLIQDRLAQRGGELTIVVAPELEAYSNWAEDALTVSEFGLARALSTGKVQIAALRLEFANQARATFDNGVVTIGVAPHEGYAGRPSSEAILRAILLSRS